MSVQFKMTFHEMDNWMESEKGLFGENAQSVILNAQIFGYKWFGDKQLFLKLEKKGNEIMNWKLFNCDGEFLREVNCQYDASDIATMMYDAKQVILDFDKQEAKIIK